MKILGLLAIIFFIFSISSCQDAARQKGLVNQERRMRLEMEEKMMSLAKQNADLKQESGQLQEMLEQEKATHQEAQQELNQEFSRLEGEFNQEIAELREELEKITRLKEKLEEDLKDALVSPGSGGVE